jgi:uncharacterized phage protein gp47/JayE
MANLVLKSATQIQTEILAKLIAILGITDVNAGSVADVLTQAIAQQDFALYYQIAQVTRLVDIDNLTGSDLDAKAFEYGLTRIQAQKAQNVISIFRPVGFEKVSTTFYAGTTSPIAGQTTISVNDASNPLIGTSGTLIIGRGTNNEEEVSYAIAPVDHTLYWTFSLSSPLVNNHSVQETVILKQGSDIPIAAGTTIVVSATGVSNQISFTTNQAVTLLSGEAEIDGVAITASVAGSSGNIPIGAISGTSAFPTPPFIGARAENLVKFTNGIDLETDDALRDRIKSTIPALSKGVFQALQNAIVGLVDPETSKRVVSASIVLPVAPADAVKVYIDDGTGFEPSFSEVGFESILNNSVGGEQRLQLAHFPVVKAQLETVSFGPYDLSSGSLTLTYSVANQSETITLQPSFFVTAAIAQPSEVVTAINNLANLIEARTSEGGSKIVITAKADTNEYLQVTGGTANAILNFPTNVQETLHLYDNDVKLSKDGLTATLISQNEGPYDLSAIGSFPLTLTIIVDGKSANVQTATVGSSDVVVASAATAQEIVNVLNRDLSGIVASTINAGTRVQIQSLTELSSGSKLQVTGGSLNNSTFGTNFVTSVVQGADSDYTFNRELGIIQLTNPLTANQAITAGSIFTRAKLRASLPEMYVVSSGQTLLISVDGGIDQTITFDGTFSSGQPASYTANFINARIKGATAIVRSVNGQNYLEINTNSYSTSGSIRIESTSTANSSFGFTTNTTVLSNTPDKAFIVSGNASPYAFAQNDSLVIVVDNDIVNKTFNIVMDFDSTLSGSVSTTVFSASSLTSVFPINEELVGYHIAFLTGPNSSSDGIVDTVASLGSNIWRYHFSTLPTSLSQYQVGDLVSFASLATTGNNGYFVIQNVGADYVDVFNLNGLVSSGESGTSVLSEKRQISDYNSITGQMIVSSAFSNSNFIGSEFIVLPSTVDNMVDFLNNLNITSFSLVGNAEGVTQDTHLQLSSKSQGSDGFIQVTGGNANLRLGFTTILTQGIEAYAYYTGLTKLVNQTIYGDDTNLEAFPGYGAAGVTFRVLAPTVEKLRIQLTLTLANGVTIAALQNSIESAITGYVNTLGLGNEVIIEQIRSAVIQVPGVVDVSLISPTQNIPIAQNEVARVSATDIVIG